MTAISRLTRAASETQRVERGENRIPGVWRARVVYVRDVGGASQAGVYVTVPNFTQGEIHGPVQVVGDTPVEGDLVVAVAVEGRKNDWIIITSSGVAELEARLWMVEGRVTDAEMGLTGLGATVGGLSSELSGLRTAHDALKLAHDILTGDVTDLADQVTSQHGDTVNAIGLLETQMGVLDSVVEAHQLGEVTWWSAADMSGSGDQVRRWPIESYTPVSIQRAARMEVDVITDDLRGFSLFSVTPQGAVSPLFSTVDLVDSGDDHRYRFQLDFHIPANTAVELRLLVRPGSGSRSGRIGFTRPVITTPVVRSA